MTTPADDQTAALAREVDRLARRLADADLPGLAADVLAVTARADQADQAAHIADQHIRVLAEAIKRLSGPASGGLLCWLTQGPPASPGGQAGGGPGGEAGAPPARLTAEEAGACLVELAQWLADVYLRYPNTDLPSCWAWHPAVIEELWWLRGAHVEAFTGKGTTWARGVGDWHERLRPGVVRRIAGWIGTCDLTRHELPGGDRRDRGAPAVPMAVHLPVVAACWSSSRETPVPDAAALDDAERQDRSAAAAR